MMETYRGHIFKFGGNTAAAVSHRRMNSRFYTKTKSSFWQMLKEKATDFVYVVLKLFVF